MGSIEPLADGTRLVHIGPRKTATTAVQASFHASRAALAEHSIHYAGKSRHSRAAATAVAMGTLGDEFSPDALEKWDALAREIRESEARITVLSSEGLSHANKSRARKITRQIGGPAHVVITMRSPARIVPSAWQQRVRRGSDQPLDAWLDQVFHRGDDGELTATHYWDKFGLDRLITTWSPAVGAENITVIVLDSSNHAMVLHAFEDLVGAPRGTLPQVPNLSNESFPPAELEALRQFNERFFAHGWTRRERITTIRGRGLDGLRRTGSPSLAGSKVEVPRWVAEQANEISAQWIEMLGTFPGRVIGNPEHLLVDPERYPESTQPADVVSVQSAGLLAHVMYGAARTLGEELASKTSGKVAATAPAPRVAAPVAPPRGKVAGARRRLGAAWRALRGR